MTSSPERNERDLALVRRFQAGDETAFDHLVREHRVEVYRLAHRLTGNHADADDLAQEAFLRVFRALPRFRGESAFRTWLIRVVLNLAADRGKARLPRCLVPLEKVPEGVLPRVSPPGNSDLLRKANLDRAVSLLPPRQRETLILRIFQEMKFHEIAAVMGCTVGTAKANFFHAVKGLRGRVRV
ncbi:MAG TPA: sigma-70 family RNA polymerase sigma factor [Candidatus Polarisedimenticolia bacterium]|jgi:RNA polymerase sigma-70 factor (ECF subfamily)|nr:sigma-70 family RNA polymerase sigma factor [Candidatus Polarisedimenticolia bacterium]